MKKILSCLLALLLLPAMALAMEIVEPGEDFYYLDEPDVLSRDTEGEIYFCNQLLEEQCGSQIVVVVLNSIGGADMLDYAVELANAWEIGDPEKNNGFVLLMTTQDEDYYAVPGDGLQGIFPASVIKGMFDNYLETDFAAGNYDEGTRKFFEAVYQRISDYYNLSLTPADGVALYNDSSAQNIAPQPTDPTARKVPRTSNTIDSYDYGYDYDSVNTYSYEPDYDPPRESSSGFGFIFWLIVVLVIIFSVASLCGRSRRRRRGEYYDAPPPPPRHPFLTGLFVGSAMHRHNNPPPPPRRGSGPSSRPPRPPRSSGYSGGGAGRNSFSGGGAGRGGYSGGASRSSSSHSSGSSSRGSFGGARGGGGGHFGGGAGRGRH